MNARDAAMDIVFRTQLSIGDEREGLETFMVAAGRQLVFHVVYMPWTPLHMQDVSKMRCNHPNDITAAVRTAGGVAHAACEHLDAAEMQHVLGDRSGMKYSRRQQRSPAPGSQGPPQAMPSPSRNLRSTHRPLRAMPATQVNMTTECFSPRPFSRSESGLARDDEKWEWLYTPTAASRTTHKSFVEKSKNDGFIKLAEAVGAIGDSTQQAMITKMYLFLRDCIPAGFTGTFEHLDGNDIMRHLLCHKGETTPSRHKATRYAEASFTKLEAWMARGTSWQTALEAAKSDFSEGKAVKGKRKLDGLAPGLHSPAGMLALLVIAHPDDDKFKKWIVRKLQIDWMLRDRKSLEVSVGFWKGLRVDNIREVFGREEERQAESDLLVDYSGLLGPQFISAKQDIRPHLPDWVLGLDLGAVDDEIECRRADSTDPPANDGPGEPTDENECSHAENGPDERGSRDRSSSIERQDVGSTSMFPLEDMLALRKCLRPTEALTAEPGEWLCKKVAAVHQEVNHPLVHWCRHWHLRMKEAVHYRDQLVTRSLFQRSLHTLHLLDVTQIPSVNRVAKMRDGDMTPDDSVSWPLICCYALIDIEDGTSRGPVADRLAEGLTVHLRRFPAGRAWCDIIAQARSLMPGRDRDQLEAEYQAQLASLLHITKESPFHDHLFGMVAFDALRMLALMHHRQGRASDQLVSHKKDSWRRLSDDLLAPKESAQLKLTRWQRLEILLSETGNGVLTPRQELLYRSRTCPDESRNDGEDVTSLSALECMPVITPATLGSFNLNRELRDALGLLLGEVQQPATVPNNLLDPELTCIQPASVERPEGVRSIIRSSIIPASTQSTSEKPAGTLRHDTTDSHSRGPASVAPAKSHSPAMTNGQAKEVMGRNATSSSCHAESSGPELRAQSTYVPETNVNHVRNAFSGYFIATPKRSASPTGSRPSKLPRVGIRADLDSLRQEMAEDLRTQLDIQGRRLREEVDQILKVSLERLCEAFRESLQMHVGVLTADLVSLKSQLASLVTQVGFVATRVEDMATTSGGWKAGIEKVQTDLIASQETHAKASETNIRQLQDEVKAGTEGLRDMGERLGTVKASFDASMQSILESMTHPCPEHTGYLTKECPAPEGEDQREFEARLFQACLFYICTAWYPYDGESVAKDFFTLEETKKRYPDLPEDLLVRALERFHVQVFNRPLGRDQDQAPVQINGFGEADISTVMSS